MGEDGKAARRALEDFHPLSPPEQGIVLAGALTGLFSRRE